MPTYILQLLSLLCFLTWLSACGPTKSLQEATPPATGKEPADFYFLQRATPQETFSHKAYVRALEDALQRGGEKTGFPGFDRPWVTRGPANIGARINTVAIHPTDPNTMYAGFSGGGLFKTTDGGIDWQPIFDDQPFLAIGHVSIDPNQPETVYVGTGDPNISGYPFIGNGVYKSTNGGQTWTHLGLTEQSIVSKVILDPSNPNVIYAATMGLPFERNEARGLYKSVNGGQSWTKVLAISDQAGIIDLVMHPTDPLTLYAAGWDRIRNNQESLISGTAAKVFKTIDGGQTWTVLTGGLPTEPASRIGLAISQSDPNVVYAEYVGTNLSLQEIYRSNNAGQTWAATILPGQAVMDALASFGWYFAKIRVNPTNPDDIFLLGVDLWRSLDGGQNWFEVGPPWWSYEFHADKHDLVFLADGHIIVATDGGLYRLNSDGSIVEDIEDIATTQFYRVAYNPHQPDWYFGGAQDNGTTGGMELSQEWPRIYGGDGFQAAFHPTLPNVFYAETQNGGIVVTNNNGDSWQSATNGLISGDRRNWDMPYFISTHNPSVLYTGTFRMYKSTSGTLPFWQPVSESLTDPVVLNPRYYTITTLHESPVVEGLVYTGVTDGNLWRTDDGGNTWTSISAGLPKRYVTDVKASPTVADRVYVTHSGYKDNEFTPRLFRSDNRGATWQDISGDLPDLAINDVFVIPGHQDSIIFVGNDGGVYGTINGGQTWARLGNNMPSVPVYDLEHNVARNELVAGTHGRSILSFPLDSVGVQGPDSTVSVITPEFAFKPLRIFPSPAKRKVQVGFQHFSTRPYQIALLDMSGRLIETWTGTERGEVLRTIDLRRAPAGTYVVKVKSGSTVMSAKVVKE